MVFQFVFSKVVEMQATKALKGFTSIGYYGDRWMAVGIEQGRIFVGWYRGTNFVDAPILSIGDWAKAFEALLKTDEVANSPTLSHLSLKILLARSPLEKSLSEGARAGFAENRKIVIGPAQFTRTDNGVNPNACVIMHTNGKTRVGKLPLETMAEFAAWLLSDPILKTELKKIPSHQDIYRDWLPRRKPECFDEKGFLIAGREKDFVTEPVETTPPVVLVSDIILKGENVVVVAEEPNVKPKAEENPAGVFLWCLGQTLRLTENSPDWVPPGFTEAVKKLVVRTTMTYLSTKGVTESKPAEVMDIAQAEAKLKELKERLERESVARLTVLQREVNQGQTDLAAQRADLEVQIANLKSGKDELNRERAEFEGVKLKWSQEKAVLEEQMELMQVMLGSAEANATATS